MRTFNKSLLTAAFIGTTALALPMMSQAQGLALRLSQVGGPSITIGDNLAGDDNPSIGNIGVDTGAGSPFATMFGNILDASSNISTSYNIGAAVVTQASNATLGLAQGVSSPLTFTVETSQQGIVFPAFLTKQQTSSSAYTFGLQPVGEQATFQSNIDVNNGQFTASTSGKVQTGINDDPNSGSANDKGNGYTFNANTYSFNSITTINIAPSTNNSGTVQVIGNGRIVAVPEPGSIAMLIGMGVSGSAFVLRRRRAIK